MGINKNFVVKNGLEVDTDLILANAITNRVGIGTSLPTHLLHVNGGIAGTHISISGVATISALTLEGTLSIGNTYGSSFQYLRATGTGGVEWAPLPQLRTSVSHTATVGQVEFTFAPLSAYIDVYINGVKQLDTDYTWTNGLKIELTQAALEGDIIEIIGYNSVTSGSGGEGTAISGLTILESDVIRGSAGLITSINFVGPTVEVTASGTGVTVYSSGGGGGGGESLWASTVTGIHTLSNVGIGTTNSPNALTVIGNASVSGLLTSQNLSVVGLTTLGITTIGSSSLTTSLYVNGGVNATGVVTASYFEGDGSRLTNISAQAIDTGWINTLSGISTTKNVGIGTTNTNYQLEVGAFGDNGISLYVNGDIVSTGNQFFSGITTSSLFETDTGGLSISNSEIDSPGLITIGGTAVRITGNFYVDGTQSITSSVYLQVTDKIIGLGTTTSGPTDIGADGGGIILYGDTNKEFLWNYADNAWTSNVNINLIAGNSIKIGGQEHLSHNLLTVDNANISGVSTVGLLTASSVYSTQYTGNGNGLSGIVTSIVAGENITINNSVGRVIISATGGGGGGGASVTIGDTSPSSPTSGNLWWDSSVGRGFIYYVDNDSAQWVDFSPNGGTPSNSISIQNNGVPLPQAISTINFNGNVSISTSLSGIATVGINTALTVSSALVVNGITTTSQLNVGTAGTVITTTSNGNVGIGSTVPTDKLTIIGGDISVGINTSSGLILTSPNGTRYRLIVSDGGALSTVPV